MGRNAPLVAEPHRRRRRDRRPPSGSPRPAPRRRRAGVEPPVRTTSPPCSMALSSIAAAGRERVVENLDLDAHRRPPPPAHAPPRAPARRWGRAAAPASRPRPGSGPRPGRRRARCQDNSSPSASRCWARRPPRPRSSESEHPPSHPTVTPARPGGLLFMGGQRDLDLTALPPGARTVPRCVPPFPPQRRGLPVEARGEPAGQEQRRWRVSSDGGGRRRR